jgi:hypothetical protein
VAVLLLYALNISMAECAGAANAAASLAVCCREAQDPVDVRKRKRNTKYAGDYAQTR